MKNIITGIVLSSVLLISCGGSGSEGASSEMKHEVVVNDDVKANASAKLAIEGMECAHNCAGTIQKEVSAMKGVRICEVDFENKSAVVEFDNTQVKESDILDKIGTLNDGAYKAEVITEEMEEEEKEIEEAVEAVEAMNAVHMGASQMIKVKHVVDLFKSVVIQVRG